VIFKIGSEDLIRELAQSYRFICFGYGAILKALCRNTGIAKSIDAVADNNEALWNTCGHIDDAKFNIICPDEIGKYLTDKHILLITTTYYKQVQDQLYLTLTTYTGPVYYFPSDRDLKYEEYAKLHIGEPLKDIIVFRSGLTEYVEGFDFSDNAKLRVKFL